MKFLKTLGLAAVAAVAAMAFIGTSFASANEGRSTALCLENVLVCPAGQVYTGHIEGYALNPELLSKDVDVVCENSRILGNALGLGQPQVTHIESIVFNTCLTKDTHIPCTTTTESIGLVDLLKTGPNTGHVLSLGNSVKVVCGFVLNCTFGGEPLGTATGSSGTLTTTTLGGTSSLGTILVDETELENVAGTICPEKGLWDASYSIQLPHQAYITE